MVYRRAGRKGFSFQARTQTGWEQIGTGASSKALALRIENMWDSLAQTYRAWDILEPVLTSGRSRPKRISALYDLWVDVNYDITAMRHRLNDSDLSQYIEEFLSMYAKDRGRGTSEAVQRYIEFLVLENSKLLVSSLTPDFLNSRMHEYPGGLNSLRKVHSAWSVFFDYLVQTKGILAANPMARVPRAKRQIKPIEFYELEEVLRIVDAQPNLQRRAMYALIYGSAIEQSIATGDASRRKGDAPKVLPLTRAHFNEETHEFRASGSKTVTRDRIALVADWAWPIVFEYLKDQLPRTPLFPFHHSSVSHWHLDTVRELKLPQYPLHSARHHWAVRQLRAGTPVSIVQSQLGHGTAKETLDTYGRFIPASHDRATWERRATEHDTKRKRASGETC